MSAILGISAFYHDSAAALIVDGRLVNAAQEERFTRKKHDPDFPANAAAWCLRDAGIDARDLDWVVFYEKPLLKFDRLLETYLAYAPKGFLSFRKAIPEAIRSKLHLPNAIRKGLGGGYTRRFLFASHHESHAASAFFPSPFETSAILTVDGVGEWATATVGIGRGNRLELLRQMNFPHSLGLLYSAFTYFCGFRVNSGEYKLMGLAPYGEPSYAGLIRERLIDLKPDGSFRMDMSYFDYAHGLTMTSPRFHALFGGEPRRPESPITQREMDIAASIQVVTEEILLKMAFFAHEITGEDRLCLAGGVALNCVANGRLLREGPFRDLWIQPASGDSGGALGAALLTHHQILGNDRVVRAQDGQRGSLLGPEYSSDQIERALRKAGAEYTRIDDRQTYCDAVAETLAKGLVVGWFQGAMEYGPRALGARSILGDPRRRDMQSTMNLKIKFRESFRPFAPAVIADHASRYFTIDEHVESPYMLLVASVKGDSSERPAATGSGRGFERLSHIGGPIPAVTHVDGSARIQTVDANRNPLFHGLLESFHEKTGCPVLINTSFNVRGEPIVLSPEDAYRCFLATEIDALAIGPFLVMKTNNPAMEREKVEAHLSQFSLD